MTWDAVKEALATAKGAAFDGCHKIYLAMDDEELALSKSQGYGDGTDNSKLVVFGPPHLLVSPDDALADRLALIKRWYDSAPCGLEFVYAVSTNHEDPNAGYVRLIAQGDDPNEPAEVPTLTKYTVFGLRDNDAEGELIIAAVVEGEVRPADDGATYNQWQRWTETFEAESPDDAEVMAYAAIEAEGENDDDN